MAFLPRSVGSQKRADQGLPDYNRNYTDEGSKIKLIAPSPRDVAASERTDEDGQGSR
jgi:hypothetical protein